MLSISLFHSLSPSLVFFFQALILCDQNARNKKEKKKKLEIFHCWIVCVCVCVCSEATEVWTPKLRPLYLNFIFLLDHVLLI